MSMHADERPNPEDAPRDLLTPALAELLLGIVRRKRLRQAAEEQSDDRPQNADNAPGG